MLPLTMPLKDMDILCDTIATISDNPTGAPVHVGIFGNDEADFLAQRGREIEQIDEVILY